MEYAAELNVNLCFQGFEQELKSLPGVYAPPTGQLLIATVNGAVAGCVALREHSQGTAEMKRLYVRPAFRGTRVGAALCDSIIGAARSFGYNSIVLDTLASLKPAIALYKRRGFRTIQPYYANPLPEVVYMRLDIRPTG